MWEWGEHFLDGASLSISRDHGDELNSTDSGPKRLTISDLGFGKFNAHKRVSLSVPTFRSSDENNAKSPILTKNSLCSRRSRDSSAPSFILRIINDRCSIVLPRAARSPWREKPKLINPGSPTSSLLFFRISNCQTHVTSVNVSKTFSHTCATPFFKLRTWNDEETVCVCVCVSYCESFVVARICMQFSHARTNIKVIISCTIDKNPATRFIRRQD